MKMATWGFLVASLICGAVIFLAIWERSRPPIAPLSGSAPENVSSDSSEVVKAAPIHPIETEDVPRTLREGQRPAGEQREATRVPKELAALSAKVARYGGDASKLNDALRCKEKRELARELSLDFIREHDKLMDQLNIARSETARSIFSRDRSAFASFEEESGALAAVRQMQEPWKIYYGDRIYVIDLRYAGDPQYETVRQRAQADITGNRAAFAGFVRDL